MCLLHSKEKNIFSQEDIEKLESVLLTEEAKEVLETALTTDTPNPAPEEAESPFIIDEEEANKILEVTKQTNGKKSKNRNFNATQD